ncbi:MAG: tetratricopeptide repeat protein, partial [Rhodothermales bacterium]
GAINAELASDALGKIQQDETHEEKAYELYARARQRANQMGVKDFEDCKQLYEKALELDPNYALAYSGLGALYVLQFIAKTDPADLDRGRIHLEKAIEIDPDTAEPYVYLGYYHSRKGNPKEASEALRKALALEDNHPVANYFLGTGLLAAGTSGDEYNNDLVTEGVGLLKRSIELAPDNQAAYMMLACFYMMNGQYDAATPLLEKNVELQREQKGGHFKFVGGLTLYGNVLFRLRRLDLARVTYENALTHLDPADHVYKQTFLAQTHCGLGDVEYVQGNYDEAVKYYGRAADSSAAHPESLGIGYFFVRGCAGLGKSFFRLAINRDARSKAREAEEALRDKKVYNFAGTWEAGDGLANAHLASCYGALQQKEDTVRCLREAVRLGWRELPQVEADEGFTVLRGDPRFDEIVAKLRSAKPLP